MKNTPDTIRKKIRNNEYSKDELYNMECMYKSYPVSTTTTAKLYEVQVGLYGSSNVDNSKTHDKEDKIELPVEDSMDIRVARKILQLKKSADSRGKEFSLRLSDVKALLSRKRCYYTGVAFEVEGDNKRTVDRLDNTKGYIKSNVVSCTHWANQMKENLYENPNPMIKHMRKLINKVDIDGNF